MDNGVGARAPGKSMKPPSKRRVWGRTPMVWRDERAAQLAEFAIALPLLVFFVVGIFDFSGAFTLKQKLTNIARDAARVAAGDPANDLQFPNTTAPASVVDAFQVIDNYFKANNLNDCGITISASSTLTWTFTASGNGCTSPGLTITINRGYFLPSTGASLPPVECTATTSGGTSSLTIVGTCVSIQYAYSWRFGRVASLLGMTDFLPAQISATAVALNEN
jgi:Flp pilus assembly protein TadG